MFAQFRLVVLSIIIKEALINALVVGQEKGLFRATCHLIQLLCQILGHVFLRPTIIVVGVILVDVVAAETLFLKLFPILRVKLVLPGCKNFFLFCLRLVLVQFRNAIELIPRK